MGEEHKLKSAFDLAMERMAQRGEGLAALTDEQKSAMAEVSRKTTAKIAEIEILFARDLEAARAPGGEEKLRKIEEDKGAAIRKLRAKEAEQKERIRRPS